jgi:hypothetical protein
MRRKRPFPQNRYRRLRRTSGLRAHFSVPSLEDQSFPGDYSVAYYCVTAQVALAELARRRSGICISDDLWELTFEQPETDRLRRPSHRDRLPHCLRSPRRLQVSHPQIKWRQIVGKAKKLSHKS